jgi:hypothetical protein
MSSPIDPLLPYLSFALSLGGLAAQLLFPPGSKKSATLLIVATCLVVITGAGLYEAHAHTKRIEEIGDEIASVLGNETKTFDEIYQALFKVDLGVAIEALDDLVKDKRVVQKLLEARDSFGTTFTFRGYYVAAKG